MTLSGPASQSYISQRLKLHYADWGNADAPPLLLVHGGRDHCRSWDWVAEELRRDWHVIAPDLRGHGDSQWVPDGSYELQGYVYDIAQLIHQLGLAPVTIIAHSLGGNVCTRYTGLYPETVKKLVVIEGLGPSPTVAAERDAELRADRMRRWIDTKRNAAGRLPRRYPTIEAALERMKSENTYLTDEQARHLTIHGVNQNEDGSWTWKFDNYLNNWDAFDISRDDIRKLWEAITCPVLLMYGLNSWASSPGKDGRMAHFKDARLVEFENAGHWLHHDQFDRFLAEVRGFI